MTSHDQPAAQGRDYRSLFELANEAKRDHLRAYRRRWQNESAASSPWAWIEKATNEQLRERLYEIGPPWGNPKLLACEVEECAWIAFEALDRLESK